MSSKVPVAAFCSSDEEEEDPNTLLYLAIAPEIEEPEDHYVPGIDSGNPDGAASGSGDSPSGGGSGGSKRNAGESSNAKENASPAKKKKTKTTEIALPNAPKDGTSTKDILDQKNDIPLLVLLSLFFLLRSIEWQ